MMDSTLGYDPVLAECSGVVQLTARANEPLLSGWHVKLSGELAFHLRDSGLRGQPAQCHGSPRQTLHVNSHGRRWLRNGGLGGLCARRGFRVGGLGGLRACRGLRGFRVGGLGGLRARRGLHRLLACVRARARVW